MLLRRRNAWLARTGRRGRGVAGSRTLDALTKPCAPILCNAPAGKTNNRSSHLINGAGEFIGDRSRVLSPSHLLRAFQRSGPRHAFYAFLGLGSFWLEAQNAWRYSYGPMPTEGKGVREVLRDAIFQQLGVSSESLQKIKLGRGAVGKITVIAVAALTTVGLVGWRVSGNAAIMSVVGGLCLIALAALGCVLYVIVKQPDIAVLEGAELVLYKHVTLGAKGEPPIAIPAATIPNTLNAGDEQGKSGSE